MNAIKLAQQAPESHWWLARWSAPRALRGALVVALMVTGALYCPSARAQSSVAETTLSDQTDVAVTVYNNNLALVRDRRTVDLPTGKHDLKFMDVASAIRPETVSLKSFTAPGSLVVLEQNYEYDLMNPQKLMEKYVGKKVKLLNFDKNNTADFSVDAELLSVNNGPIYKVGDQIFLGHPGVVVLPQIPKNLISKPTLVWLVNNERAKQDIEVSYLTGGMSWQADYVLTVNKDTTKMDVAGWVTLKNESGTAYTNAQLKVVAGQVNVVPQSVAMGGGARMEKMAMARAPQMQEESFAEYHLYTLPRRTTIKENQSKQVSLLTASDVSIHKVYEFRGNVSYYSQQMPELKSQKVGVFVVFENKEANHLGMPLPAGVMRIYQADKEGSLQFAGEDRIDHTPKDEEVRLRMGQAFDVVGDRVNTDFKVIASNRYESAYKLSIRNHKEEDIDVDIVEPMPSDWTILESSQDFKKRDAHTAVFSVHVPKDGEAVVTYRVRVQY